MFNPLVKILGVLALVFTTAVNAEEKDPFDITVYGSFLHTGTVPNALFFFNDIEQYDSFELRRAIRNHDIDIVVLASDGGSVWEGLNMAGIIHDKGIATYVPELPEKLGCYSACSFMFFGGKIRQADGILAVHQAGAYGSELDKASAKVSETQQNTQFTVSEIIGFLNEFETPPWVFEKMFRSREFYFFDQDEKDRLASRNEEISTENLYEINAFVSSFLKYLDDLAEEEKKVEEEKESEISEEEQLRLAVIEIQKLLNAAGCNAGFADGIWGRKTRNAATLFAKTSGLPIDDENFISETFIKKLRSAPVNFCPKPKTPALPYFGSEYKKSCSNHNRTASVKFDMARGARKGMFVVNWHPSTFQIPVEIVSSSNAKLRYSGGVRDATLTVNENGLVTSFRYPYRRDNANVVCKFRLVKQ